MSAASLSPDLSHPAAWSTSIPSHAPSPSAPPKPSEEEVENITIIGSTATSDYKPRLFRIDTPLLPFFFSGTGDMFAALTVPRLIEAVKESPSIDLSSKPSWRSPDDVPADELPLAKACQKVLASMQSILGKTSEGCKEKMKAYDARAEKDGRGRGVEDEAERAQKRHVALMNASEVKVVRHVGDIVGPPELERFTPKVVEEGRNVSDDQGWKKVDDMAA
jgi:pyridoxine kinase